MLGQGAGASPDTVASSTGAVAPLRAGAIGGVGFPRLLAIEAMAELYGVVGIGGEYGALPTVTVDGVSANLWSLAGDVRLFPFRFLGGPVSSSFLGSFFVGARLGRQHIGANTTVSVAMLGSATEVLGIDSWYVNPRLGFLWTVPQAAGLTFGVDAGVQVPWGVSTSSTLPLSLAPSGAQQAVRTLGNSVLPTIDLLRVGLLL